MRVLWLCNSRVTGVDAGQTGTWLGSLGRRLANSGQVELTNVTVGQVATVTRDTSTDVDQWLVPVTERPTASGLPRASLVQEILNLVEAARPDVIHVWGTERYWGLLTARGLLRQRAVLETQGLKFAIARQFEGRLSPREQLSCIGVKELLRGNTIPQGKRTFERWGEREREIIAGHSHITVQTDWLEAQVRPFNPSARIHRNDFTLRDVFYQTEPWSQGDKPTIYCSSAYSAPFKGLHVAVRALALLARRVPDIRLRVAGAQPKTGLGRDGYLAWVQSEARRLGVHEAVEWLGPQDGRQVAETMRRSSVVLIPSFVEGYCLALAEAMCLGVPAVCAFSGGAACLAEDGESALYFTPGDEAMCAWQLERVLNDATLGSRLSAAARALGLVRNNPDTIIAKQIEIHKLAAGSE